MLDENEITPEIRFLPVDRQAPRSGGQQQHGQRDPRQDEQHFPLLIPDQIGPQSDRRNGKSQKTFGQERQSAEESAEDQQDDPPLPADIVLRRQKSGKGHTRHKESQEHIRDRHTGEDGHERQRGKNRRAEQGQPPVVILAHEQINDPGTAEHGEHAGKPQSEPVHSEDFERNGKRPVTERSLFEITDAVEPRRDPVAALEHFPGDLGIPGLVGCDQRASSQRKNIYDQHHRCDQEI